MLKFLALILIFVLFLRSIGFLIRFLFGGGLTGRSGREFHEGYNRKKRPSGGNVDIDYVPKQENKKNKGFKGGDYVDYEEVS